MRTLITLATAIFLMLSVSTSSEPGDAVMVEGEVVCLTCYLKDGPTATGADHVGCAEACASRGLPQAILDPKTADLYLPITTEMSKRGTDEEQFVCSLVEHSPTRKELQDYFGKTVTVTGKTYPGYGTTLLEVHDIVVGN